MDTRKFKGIFPALLTPFGADGKINEKALAELIEMNIAKGVSGFYVCGSTAEVFLLSEEERKTLYRLVKEIAGERVTLIAHVGDISTDKAIEYARLAEALGYDAVSAVAPFYYKFSFAEIKKYYFDIVSAVSLPMIVYNFPNFSGVTLSAEQIGEFFADERFIGLKHTSADTFALSRIKTAFPEKVVFNGFDEMMLGGLSMGADGGIGSTYNFMAEKFIKLLALFRENKMAEAQELQKEINVIIAALCEVGVMQGEKAILCAMGLDFGKMRAPFGEIPEEKKNALLAKVMPLLA
ncbi:MAG: N-acetylneuraminate lyase [Clostridia bacterium]|nr:N-acetylneuraminate lyase [Clostridia bacterium]